MFGLKYMRNENVISNKQMEYVYTLRKKIWRYTHNISIFSLIIHYIKLENYR